MKKHIERKEDNVTPTGVILFDMEDGGEVITFDLNKVSAAASFRLALHGASQKIGDSAANAAKQENPTAWAREQIQATINQLYAMKEFSDWRASGGSSGPRVTDLAVAIARVTGQPLDAVVEQVDAMTDEQKKEFRSKAKIKAVLAQIAAEKALERARKAAAAAAAEEGKDEE